MKKKLPDTENFFSSLRHLKDTENFFFKPTTSKWGKKQKMEETELDK